MNILQSIILGFTEGVTEFLPVSSSGHLILVRKLLHLQIKNTLAFDAILQFATALALAFYFRKEMFRLIQNFILLVSGKQIIEKEKIVLWSVILGTIPAIVFGLLLQSSMDSVFRNVKLVGLMLLLGSGLMWYAQRKSGGKLVDSSRQSVDLTRAPLVHSHQQGAPLSVKKGIVIGFYQCLALVPGVSRSGATISGGLLSGLSQEEAVRFSFLLSIPILLGSGLKELFSIRHQLGTVSVMPLFWGSLTAFVVGYLAIHYFLRFLKNHNLNLFIFYRIAIFLAIFFLF